MPPRDLETWFSGAPWSAPGHDFHEYFRKVTQPENFMRFGNGTHELAHFILCEEKNILDPFWGMGHPFDGIPPFEAQVLFVDILIDEYCSYGFWKSEGYGSTETITANAYNATRSFFGDKWTREHARNARFARQNWTIEKLWKELQRKRELLRTLL